MKNENDFYHSFFWQLVQWNINIVKDPLIMTNLQYNFSRISNWNLLLNDFEFYKKILWWPRPPNLGFKCAAMTRSVDCVVRWNLILFLGPSGFPFWYLSSLLPPQTWSSFQHDPLIFQASTSSNFFFLFPFFADPPKEARPFFQEPSAKLQMWPWNWSFPFHLTESLAFEIYTSIFFVPAKWSNFRDRHF